MKNIFKLFIIWRILLFIPVIVGFYLLNYGTSFPFFEINAYQKIPEFLNQFPIKVWANFDGVHYFNIAFDGYKNEARFFPLLSIFIYLLSFGSFSLGFTFIIAVLLPNLFFILTLIIFYKLLRLDYSEKISFKSLSALTIFPTAFFFICVYTESLFMFLLFLCFYFARKEKWFYASFAGMLLTLTKLSGIFIVPALIYEYFLLRRKFSIKDLRELILIIIGVPLGIIGYSIFNYYKWNDFLRFVYAHTEIGNSRTATALIFPLQTVYRYLKILTSIPLTQTGFWIALLELSSFIFGAIMLYIAWRKRIRASYLIFSVPAFLLPVLSGTFSGLPRYLLISFPIFIVLGLIENKKLKMLYFIVSTILLFILLMFFTKGYYIA